MRVSAMLRKISAMAAAVLVAAGCSMTPDYSAPASFTVGNDAVAHVVQQALARTPYATPEDGSPTVDCSGEIRCTVAYTVQEPVGFIYDVELVLPTRQMWKAMFADPHFQHGTITVSGPQTSPRGKETSVFFTLSCDRGAASRIDWNNAEATQLKSACKYTRQIELPVGGLNGSTGVAVDTAGNLYVTDNRNNRVLRLPPGPRRVGSPPSHTDPVELPLNVQAPSDVAVVGGDVYVTDKTRVLKLPGAWNSQIELPFAAQVPLGLAVDNSGDVYVADGGNGRVLKLSAWSTTQVEVPFGGDADGLRGGLAVDNAGNLYAAGKDAVWKLSSGTNAVTKLPLSGLTSPNGVAVDPRPFVVPRPGKQGETELAFNVYVTDGLDKDHSRVLVLPAGATQQGELPFTDLNHPTGVAVDTEGNVYVTDSGNNRVLELPDAAVGSAIQAIWTTKH